MLVIHKEVRKLLHFILRNSQDFGPLKHSPLFTICMFLFYLYFTSESLHSDLVFPLKENLFLVNVN